MAGGQALVKLNVIDRLAIKELRMELVNPIEACATHSTSKDIMEPI